MAEARQWSAQVNERVYAWFYTEWHTATVRRLFQTETGAQQAEVLWDTEYSTSELPLAWLAELPREAKSPSNEQVRPDVTRQDVDDTTPGSSSSDPYGGPQLVAPPGLEGMNLPEPIAEARRQDAFRSSPEGACPT
eukprot:g27377.t1